MNHKTGTVVTISLVFFALSAFAQNDAPGPNDDSQTHSASARPPRQANELLGPFDSISNNVTYQQPTHSTLEIAFCIAILVFGAFVIFLEIYVMLSQKRYWDVWSFKILGLTIVVVCGMFLVVAGYTQEQIAPMMALLGTVAGYMLGKESGFAPRSQSPEKEAV